MLALIGARFAVAGSTFVWVALISTALMSACAPRNTETAAAPVGSAAPAEQARLAEATAQARAQAATIVAQRRESVAATSTVQTTERQGLAQARSAQATATAEIDLTPPYGLIGQQISTCSERKVPLDVAVEDAEVFAHSGGGLVVIAVVRVTNRG